VWQISISTSAEAEDAVACLLERQFRKTVSVYCDEATGARRVAVYPGRLTETAGGARASLRVELRRLKVCGLDVSPAKISVKLLPRENWAESWKRHFKPIEIGGALLIKPGWIKKRPRPGQRVIVLDPGLSFGTGHHPTTLFCLNQLVQARRPGVAQSFLDIGTGSGILAIAAAKLGYSRVEAFDYDPASIRVARQNVKKNHAQSRVAPRRQDLTRLKERSSRKYDVICANLTADLLGSEARKIVARLKPGGKLIVAGILSRQFEDITKILHEFGLTSEFVLSDKEWKSGQFVL